MTVVWCTVFWCIVMWCIVAWRMVVWCLVVWCIVMWCLVIKCMVVWCMVQSSMVVCCFVEWCNVVWCVGMWCNVCNVVLCTVVCCDVVSCDLLLRTVKVHFVARKVASSIFDKSTHIMFVFRDVLLQCYNVSFLRPSYRSISATETWWIVWTMRATMESTHALEMALGAGDKSSSDLPIQRELQVMYRATFKTHSTLLTCTRSGVAKSTPSVKGTGPPPPSHSIPPRSTLLAACRRIGKLNFFLCQRSKNIVEYSVFALPPTRNDLLQHVENCVNTSVFARYEAKNTVNTVIFATRGKKTL